MDVIKNTTEWFKEAKPNPTARNVIEQYSYMVEEIVELFEATNMDEASKFMSKLKEELLKVAQEGEDSCQNMINGWDRQNTLDALVDINVTTTGVATYLGMDFEKASEEVCKSNWSKFDDNGKAIINDQGKILKGSNYFKPDLTSFV